MDFQEYLRRIGFFGKKTSEEWENVRKQYRQYYMKQYNREYREKMKRLELRFPFSDFEKIQALADSFREKPTTFVKRVILAHLDASIHLPNFQDVREAKSLIRKCSNNINQLVKGAHIQMMVDPEHFRMLVSEVREMERALDELYKKPKSSFTPIQLINYAD